MQWRFSGGKDKEMLEKESRKFSNEDRAMVSVAGSTCGQLGVDLMSCGISAAQRLLFHRVCAFLAVSLLFPPRAYDNVTPWMHMCPDGDTGNRG